MILTSGFVMDHEFLSVKNISYSEKYILDTTVFSHSIIRRNYEPVEWDIVGQAQQVFPINTRPN